jgi:transporter family protein
MLCLSGEKAKVREKVMAQFTAGWQVWALLAAVFAALTAIFAKVGVEGVGPDQATFLRTLVISSCLLLILYWKGELGGLAPRVLVTHSGKSLFFLLLSGLATAASWICYFRALDLGQASQVAPLDKMSVVFVAIFGGLFLGEQLSLLGWLGVAMITGGAALMAFRS